MDDCAEYSGPVSCNKQLAGSRKSPVPRIYRGRRTDGRRAVETRRQTDDRTTTTRINHVNADSNVSIMNGNVTEAPTTTCARRCPARAVRSLLAGRAALISCASGAPTSLRPADVASLRAVAMVTRVASIRQGAAAASRRRRRAGDEATTAGASLTHTYTSTYVHTCDCIPVSHPVHYSPSTDVLSLIPIPRFYRASLLQSAVYAIIGWWLSVVTSINVVNRHWVRLLLGWVTACRHVNHLGI